MNEQQSDRASSSSDRSLVQRRPRARGDEAELFMRHHRPLLRSVGRAVSAPPQVVEDACQHAWLALMRHQPDRTPALFAWLRTVAVHQAYRLSSRERRETALEELGGESGWESLVGAARPLELTLEARATLAHVAALPTSQRHDLVLLIGGFSYQEIAQRGHRPRSLNNVNKHLTKARARLRALDAAA